MKTLGFVAPIVPGKTEDGMRFGQQITGARRKEMDASRRALGQTRESTWVQHTPQGDMLVAYLEGQDSMRANERFAASTDPFDVWFKQEATAITGVDFSQPLPANMVETILEAPQGTKHEPSLAVAFPIVPGKTDAWRRVAQQIMTDHRQDLDDQWRRFDLRKENWYLNHTPMGDIVVLYLEGANPAASLQKWAASTQSFDKWEKDELAPVHGIDFSQPLPPLPEPIFDWQAP